MNTVVALCAAMPDCAMTTEASVGGAWWIALGLVTVKVVFDIIGGGGHED